MANKLIYLSTLEAFFCSVQHSSLRRTDNNLHDVLKLLHVQDTIPVLVKKWKNEINLFPGDLLANDPHEQVSELSLGQGSLFIVESEQLYGVHVLEEVLQDRVVAGLAGVGDFGEAPVCKKS